MTVEDLLQSMYIASQEHATALLIGAFVLPALGTLVAWIGRGGESDADGRIIGSVLVGTGIAAVIGELVAVSIGVGLLGRNLLEADVRLLLAPIVLLAGGVLGIRLVFPANELGSARTARDLGLLIASCAAILGFFSRFEGWRLPWFGNFTALIVVLAIAAAFVVTLFRRVFPPI